MNKLTDTMEFGKLKTTKGSHKYSPRRPSASAKNSCKTGVQYCGSGHPLRQYMT